MTIGDSIPRAEIPALFARHDALVNNMRAGAPDKVGLRGRGVVVSRYSRRIRSSTSASAPEQRFTRWDPGALADRIRTLAALSPAERATLGGGLRERVAASHSVQSWARGILDAAGIA